MWVSVFLAPLLSFFFFNDTATTEIYTLSLHDALPISPGVGSSTTRPSSTRSRSTRPSTGCRGARRSRSEEHTSELQSRLHLVCRLLLEKKKNSVLDHMHKEADTLLDQITTRHLLVLLR